MPTNHYAIKNEILYVGNRLNAIYTRFFNIIFLKKKKKESKIESFNLFPEE